jgi:hypothetical protein
MDAVVRVFYFNQEIMIVAGLLGAYLVLFTSILMYYLRPRGDSVKTIDDPGDFDSIGSTMVLSLLMLTGQGGPSGELPWYTQCVVLLTGMFSVAMFAIPGTDNYINCLNSLYLLLTVQTNLDSATKHLCSLGGLRQRHRGWE